MLKVIEKNCTYEVIKCPTNLKASRWQILKNGGIIGIGETFKEAIKCLDLDRKKEVNNK